MAGTRTNGANGKGNGHAPARKRGPSDAARRKGAARAAETNRGRPRRVTPALYAEMFSAYMEKPSARHVSQACEVDWSTARRVIEEGYPDHAMPPLRERYRQAMAEANRKAEYRLADAHADSLKLLRGYKAKLAQRIAKMKAEELPAALGGELDRMVRLESLLLGGADSRPDLTGASTGTYDGMSYDQRLAFLRTGRLPMDGVPEHDAITDEDGEEEDHDTDPLAS